MEDQVIAERLIEDNKRIAGGLENLVKDAKWNLGGWEGIQKTKEFESKRIRGARVIIDAIYQKVDEYDTPVDPPEDFSPPIYFFHYYRLAHGGNHVTTDQKERHTTPYGIMPAIIIGQDNKLYRSDTFYLFSRDGQGKKYEWIHLDDDDANDKESQKYIKATEEASGAKIPQVDFVPSESDSRFVDLDPGDYEIVFGVLKQLESGEFS